MATEPNSTRRAAWNTAYSQYLNLSQNLDQAPPAERDALERAMAAQQDTLLDMPAPSLAAVVAKLYILFEGEMDGIDQQSEEKRLVVEDLEGLLVEAALVFGLSAPQPLAA